MADTELLERAREYAQRRSLVVHDRLGAGVHGIVFVAESQHLFGRSAIKVHEREKAYRAERDVYVRLQSRGVTRVQGCSVPQLLAFDNALWIIDMTIVVKPYVLDFAGAYLDQRPDFSVETLAEWRAEKREQFGDDWTEVERILWTLEGYGIYLLDISPNNICLDEGD